MYFNLFLWDIYSKYFQRKKNVFEWAERNLFGLKLADFN